MKSGDYLRGRVRGRRVATIAYADASLDAEARQAKLAAAAAEYSGEALDGFWRGACEISESDVRRPAAQLTGSADAADSDTTEWPDAGASASGTLAPPRSRTVALVAALSLVIAGFVAISTATRHWHPAQLAVYAGCLGYAVVNGWWLPVGLVRATTPRAQALWSLAVVAGFFGGLAGLASLARLR